MEFKKQLLNYLQVRENEWWLVRQLFFQQFFTGAGIALFFTAAFTLFLQQLSINELPKVLIASAFMQWAIGYLYSIAEHHFSIKKMILAINLVLEGSIIIFWILSGYAQHVYFFFGMLVWYYVLYLLNSLDFWGLAALLFDVRQSKRLFGIISAGDIPAKFIGYASASLIAPLIGVSNLLIVGAAAVLISLIYWNKLRKSGHLEISHQHHHIDNKISGKNETFGDAVVRFFDNKLVLNLAVLSFVICCIATLIEFVFYGKIKAASHDDDLLASYIALFLSSSYGIAIVMKLFFTNRITNALGIRGSLTVFPVVLLLILIPVYFLPVIHSGGISVLIIFGLLSVAKDALRSAILTPVFLSVMQPLRVQVRLRAHNIVKGVMDPFGLLFIGLMLYMMLMIEGRVDFYLLSNVLVGLLLISIVWIFIVNSEYARILVIALRNRYINGSEFTFNSKESLSFFIEKSAKGDATDAIFVLSLIGKNTNADALRIIDNAINHQDDRVKIEAIKTIVQMRLVNYQERLKNIAAETKNPELLHEAIKAIYTLEEVKDYDDYLNEDNPDEIKAAITGMLRNERFAAKGLKYFQNLAGSLHPLNRIIAADIIGENSKHSFAQDLIKLIHDKADDVSKAAIRASNKLHGSEIVEALLHVLASGRHEKLVLNALIENGQHAIPYLKNFMDSQHLNSQHRIKLIKAIGKISGSNAKKMLCDMLDNDVECRNEIISSLHLCHFKTDKYNEAKYRQMLHHLFDKVALIALNRQMLMIEKRYLLLSRALQLELNINREVILNLFTFFYSTEKIEHARTAFLMNKKENIANALEIIDVTVQKDFAQKFIALYDTTNPDQKSDVVEKEFGISAMTVENLMGDILQEPSSYNNWTKACALYELDNMSVGKYKSIINQLSTSGNFLVKETAAYRLNKKML